MEIFQQSELEKDLAQLILETPAPGKHCARNAFNHLEKSWRLTDVDPEMAAFRAVTAEEEAASAVFHAVRKQKYIGWENLNPRDHKQKNALIPFCEAIKKVLAVCDKEWDLKIQLTMDLEHKRISVSFNPKKMLNVTEESASFDPPLHFSVLSNERLHDFSTQLVEAAATTENARSIEDQLQRRANRRNRILYASTSGIPTVTSLNNFLIRQRERVSLLVAIYLLIDLYPPKQDFVQQGLLAFLKMLDRLPPGIRFD